ncbi:hypothetical protein P167DRAFT_297696 [Morchella conica CCBAS932]|uniref:Uncharacterized protein n=1 Tax=Morchella conica CCBAS932 TaxID=1392247 RepID=A0A3N4KME7_9PEZI|nr:hypothetical protein P167DRAFT_297696 [Morchella conica CCBAS932]
MPILINTYPVSYFLFFFLPSSFLPFQPSILYLPLTIYYPLASLLFFYTFLHFKYPHQKSLPPKHPPSLISFSTIFTTLSSSSKT